MTVTPATPARITAAQIPAKTARSERPPARNELTGDDLTPQREASPTDYIPEKHHPKHLTFLLRKFAPGGDVRPLRLVLGLATG